MTSHAVFAYRVPLRARSLGRGTLGLLALLLAAPALASPAVDWPGFRGPSASGAVAAEYPAEPALELRWKRPLGSGYSGVAVAEGRGFTAFSLDGTDWLTAFDLATGEELWRLPLAPTYAGHDGSHDGPIATPATDGAVVAMLHPNGELVIADVTGEERWRYDLDELGGEAPFYGHSSSPLVIDGTVIVEAASSEGSSVHAFAAGDGSRHWSAGSDDVEYQSPLLLSLGGRRQLVVAGQTAIAGLDPQTGDELWRHEHGGDTTAMGASTMAALAIADDTLLFDPKAREYVLLGLPADEGEKPEVRWASEEMGLTYAPAVTHGGRVYGYTRGFLTAVEVADGSAAWKSRPPGDGFLGLAHDTLVVLTKKGTLHLGKDTGAGWGELAMLPLFADAAWTEPTLVGQAIYTRSTSELAAVDVVERREDEALPSSRVVELPDTPTGRFLTELEAMPETERTAAVERFLADVERLPLVEGRHVYFLWHGAVGDLGIESDLLGSRIQEPMRRVAGTDLFYRVDPIVPNSLVSYGFVPDLGETVVDPRNPWTTTSGRDLLSWFSQGEVDLAQTTLPAEGAEPAQLHGRLERHAMPELVPPPAEGEAAPASGPPGAPPPGYAAYLPPGYDSGTQGLPTVYLPFPAAAERGGWLAEIDRAIATGASPAVIVLVSLPPPLVFGDTERAMALLTEQIVPDVERRYRVIADRRHRLLAGQTMGASIALQAALRQSAVFSAVAAQSPFMLDEDRLALEALLATVERPLDVYLEWGLYDLRTANENFDLGDQLRFLATALRRNGIVPEVHEVPHGHLYAAWSSRAKDVWRFLLAAR